MSGWWSTYPSEKWWSSSVGVIVPNIWKNTKKVPNHQPGVYMKGHIHQFWGVICLHGHDFLVISGFTLSQKIRISSPSSVFFLNIGNIRKYLKQPIVYNSKLIYLLKKITWHGHWKRAFSSLIYYFPDATAILIHQRVTSSWDLHQIPTTCSSAQLLFTA